MKPISLERSSSCRLWAKFVLVLDGSAVVVDGCSYVFPGYGLGGFQLFVGHLVIRHFRPCRTLVGSVRQARREQGNSAPCPRCRDLEAVARFHRRRIGQRVNYGLVWLVAFSRAGSDNLARFEEELVPLVPPPTAQHSGPGTCPRFLRRLATLWHGQGVVADDWRVASAS